MMIYIIEDNPWQAEQFSRVLTGAGYTTQLFTNGIDAIAAIDEAKPNVIVLDMLLAGTTGLTLLHELQSYTDTGVIPVVLCTGLAEDVDLKELAPYGVRRILDKMTMQPDDIVTAVRSVL
jgi:two-component system response regulator BaeR